MFTFRNASEQEPQTSPFPGSSTGQRLGPGACHVEGCWQTLNRGCKLWVSQRAIKRERQEICSSVINASEKSEQRVTSPQLITTRGKGTTNRYPDPVIHIRVASIMLLARLPRVSMIPRHVCVSVHAKHAWGQTPMYFTQLFKKEHRNALGDRS